MAISSSSSNSISNGSQEYPYPSHVNPASFLSTKLYGKGYYLRWQEQMTCLAHSYDMLGFIDGTLKNPKENNGSETKYREWKRSDMLVKGWIFGSVSDIVMGTVVSLQTANDVWIKLKTMYTDPVTHVSSTTISATARDKVGEYVPLCRAIHMGDWEKAEEIFNEDEYALTKKLNNDGYTTLHVAIGNRNNINFLGNLLERIKPESLPILVNNKEQNALHYAAMLDNNIAAKKLVEKNPHLLFIVDYENYLPIHKAIFNSHKATFDYLLSVCKKHIGLSKKDGYHNPFEGEKGASLLNNIILSGFLDVAYDLLQNYPELARAKVQLTTPLWCIAQKSDVYPSAKRYNFYQRFVYSHLPTKNYGTDATFKIHDVENQETYEANLVISKYTKNYPVIKKICVKFWRVALLHVSHIKNLHKDKVTHNTALMILKFICEEIAKLKSCHDEHYETAFIAAMKNNTPEVIEQISQFFPQSIWTRSNGYSISQLSVKNRCENIYNFLLHNVTHDKYLHIVSQDQYDNNLLHLAGQLAPTHKLNMVTGAALQMQREMQWFEEVKKSMRPKERDEKNKKRSNSNYGL